MIICGRDQLTGDIYVFRHVINHHHKYQIHHTTFRALNPRPLVLRGDFIPPRHRPTIAMKAWLDHLEMWTGAPPIMILHFHPTAQDAQWDCERPRAPAGVPIIAGVGCGTVAPTGAERTHAFLRKRLAKFALTRINENPLSVYDKDGTTGTFMSDNNARVLAFESIFAGGDNIPFGEFGCAIAEDALLAHGAAAVCRHPNMTWHYDTLFSYPRGRAVGAAVDGAVGTAAAAGSSAEHASVLKRKRRPPDRLAE